MKLLVSLHKLWSWTIWWHDSLIRVSRGTGPLLWRVLREAVGCCVSRQKGEKLPRPLHSEMAPELPAPDSLLGRLGGHQVLLEFSCGAESLSCSTTVGPVTLMLSGTDTPVVSGSLRIQSRGTSVSCMNVTACPRGYWVSRRRARWGWGEVARGILEGHNPGTGKKALPGDRGS